MSFSGQAHAHSRLCPVPVVGVIGGVGSGKSTVTRWVAERYPVLRIDADQLGHAVLTLPHVSEALVARFGTRILAADGRIDRRQLATLVFGETPEQQANRIRLEQIVHPEIRNAMERELRSVDPQRFVGVILDAAVLLEADWRGVCDAVVFVDAPLQDRQDRVRAQRGWTATDLAARESSQWPLARKAEAATHRIPNHGDPELAGRALWDVLSELTQPPTQQ